MIYRTRKHLWPAALASLVVFGVVAAVVALASMQPPPRAVADGCDAITDPVARAQCIARHAAAGQDPEATHTHAPPTPTPEPAPDTGGPPDNYVIRGTDFVNQQANEVSRWTIVVTDKDGNEPTFNTTDIEDDIVTVQFTSHEPSGSTIEQVGAIKQWHCLPLGAKIHDEDAATSDALRAELLSSVRMYGAYQWIVDATAPRGGYYADALGAALPGDAVDTQGNALDLDKYPPSNINRDPKRFCTIQLDLDGTDAMGGMDAKDSFQIEARTVKQGEAIGISLTVEGRALGESHTVTYHNPLKPVTGKLVITDLCLELDAETSYNSGDVRLKWLPLLVSVGTEDTAYTHEVMVRSLTRPTRGQALTLKAGDDANHAAEAGETTAMRMQSDIDPDTGLMAATFTGAQTDTTYYVTVEVTRDDTGETYRAEGYVRSNPTASPVGN